MKFKLTIITTICLAAFIIILLHACAAPQHIAEKSGAQLWAENCQRCHNTPPPNAYSDHQWETIITHMASKEALTEQEEERIVEFLTSAN